MRNAERDDNADADGAPSKRPHHSDGPQGNGVQRAHAPEWDEDHEAAKEPGLEPAFDVNADAEDDAEDEASREEDQEYDSEEIADSEEEQPEVFIPFPGLYSWGLPIAR